jgi:DNA repair exonuclease SbcCD ATPase subunit
MTPSSSSSQSSEALHEVAVALYGLRPDKFTAARTRASVAARDAGDRAQMDAIKALRRPSVSAWVVNLLARAQPDMVAQVVDLGDALRQAQSLLQGDALRELGRQRRQLISAVSKAASTLAEKQGQRITDPVVRQVEETLQAAMTDSAAAAAVRSGLLTRPLSSTGLEGLAEALAVPLGDRTPLPSPPSSASADAPGLTLVKDDDRERDEAEARVRAAGETVRAAQKAFDKATRKRAKGEAKVLQLEAELEELRRQVAEAEERTEAAVERLTELDATLEESEAMLSDARDAADAASTSLAKLT